MLRKYTLLSCIALIALIEEVARRAAFVEDDSPSKERTDSAAGAAPLPSTAERFEYLRARQSMTVIRAFHGDPAAR